VEVAASSASYDLHDKKRAYRRNGVLEYLVWQVADQTINWFSLQADDYLLLQPDQTGVMKSLVFPGLNLQVEALLAGELAKVLAIVQAGIATTDHRAFVDQLAGRANH